MLKVIRHRPVQACVIVALSALVTACAVFTPLYQRALDQASVQVELDRAAPGASGLQLTASGILPTIYSAQTTPIAAPTPAELEELIPQAVRRSFGAPVNARFVGLRMPSDAAQPTDGSLLWRAGACAHLQLVSGACPAAASEIAVSSADAKNFGWSAGSVIPVVESQPGQTRGPPQPTVPLTVSGVYRPPTDRYWAGWHLVGASGTQSDERVVFHDTWVTDSATFGSSQPWRNPSSRIDLPVDREKIGVDELLALEPALAHFQRELRRRPTDRGLVRADTGLAAVADRVQVAQDQSRITIPALMVPLGLLGLVVLWMAVGAGAEQRRPEVAVARLRGRGVRGAQAHLLRELLPTVLAGVPLGAGVAFALSWPVRHVLLPGDVSLEVQRPVWLALMLSVAAVTATAVLVSASISREPIVALLRRVPARRSGWSLGTLDAMLVTFAASILGAFATGRLTGPVAVAAPAVLALAAGLVLARLLVPVATRAGRSLLARGATGTGVAFLQVARRPGVRATIALLTVSAAILLFAADAVTVGDRNRELTARQQVGAPMVATVSGGTVRSVRDALAEVGPGRTRMTTVVVQHPLSDDDQSNLFVDRAAFLRIATFPDARKALAAVHRLDGPETKPVNVVGHSLAVDVSTESFYKGSSRSVSLAVRLLQHDGRVVSVRLGDLPTGKSPATTHQASIDCADGCVLTGWQVLTDPGNAGTGRVTVSSARTDDGQAVDLGATADWAVSGSDSSSGSRIQALDAGSQSLTMYVTSNGSSELTLAHRWVPTSLPVAVSGKLPPDSERGRFSGAGLDGVDRPMTAAARLPWLPASTSNATLVDLDLALRSGMQLGDQAELQVWFDREDRHALAAVTDALESGHMEVTAVSTYSEARRLLDRTSATWSMQLGVLVGVACLVVAALGLAIAGAATWRSRARDLAIMRLNGLPAGDVRRISVGEQLPMVVVSVLIGAGTGVLAAHYALPTLPLLPDDPAVDLVDLSAAWGPVAVLTVVTAVALCTVGLLIAALVARRASLDRVVGAP
ncbi:putative ABC transport system permease protein [Marmoricola sp. URHA0025 HA25]